MNATHPSFGHLGPQNEQLHPAKKVKRVRVAAVAGTFRLHGRHVEGGLEPRQGVGSKPVKDGEAGLGRDTWYA